MTVLVVEHAEDGTVTDWWYETDDGYEPADGEIITERDHRGLGRMVVDVDAEQPELVDDRDFDPRSSLEKLDDRVGDVPVSRGEVSEATKVDVAEAIDAGETEVALDKLFEIVTGDEVSDHVGGDE